MRFALFCDGAYSLTVVAKVAAHVLATIAKEEEVVRAVGAVVVGRRTPIVATPSGEVEQRPVTVTRSRKEDTVTVWSCTLIAFNAILCCPCPSAFIYELMHLFISRHPP